VGESWEEDLREFGVVQEEIDRLRRGLPVLCHRYGQEITYDGSDGVYVRSVPFAVYFEGLLAGGVRNCTEKCIRLTAAYVSLAREKSGGRREV
jgi:hypothetical protein